MVLRYTTGEIRVRDGRVSHAARYELRAGMVTVWSDSLGCKSLRCGDLPADLVAHAALSDLLEQSRAETLPLDGPPAAGGAVRRAGEPTGRTIAPAARSAPG